MAVVLSVGACTSTRTQKSPGEQIDDAVIATKIKSDLVGNPDTKARDIDVTVFKGRVQLNGFVDSTSERVKAAEIARGVNGVVGVDNNLKLKGPARSAGEVLDDATLSAKVKTSLIADERTKAYQIEVQTHGGVVQLAGFVDNAAARQAAEAIAREQEGVSRVDNQIAIR
jgi:osmotically-inducible protein OsmY